ncbi:MAG: hypothetical protein GF334_08165 [Candidatus Altiarchaeales archaeon]|nr:hypothetical protein [Candidatus Altiarchaeales archaeon]
MLTCTKTLTWCSAHRLLGHEGACARLHGHNYRADITYASDLDNVGRVIDFSEIKDRVGKWIDDNWDHRVLLHVEDPLATTLRRVLPSEEVYVLSFNPTAENMALVLSGVARSQGPQVVRVRVWETDSGCAEWSSIK